MKAVLDGIYKHNGRFYFRPVKPDGKRTIRRLKGHTQKQAKADYDRRVNRGLEKELTTGEALQEYKLRGCPDRRGRTRITIESEKVRVDNLLKYFVSLKCHEIKPSVLYDYITFRMKNVSKRKQGCPGRKVADMEISTLRSACRWAVRWGLLQQDPFKIIERPSYGETIRHCRETAPRSGDELHALARYFFENPSYQVYGWLILIQAMIGLRVSELLGLKVGAEAGDPGSIVDGILWLRRKKSGANNFHRIQPELASCLEAFWQWRATKSGPWWFPAVANGQKHPQAATYCEELQKAAKIITKSPRTTHGLRSMYVTVRRGQGAPDALIALEIGQITGGREIVRTYGEATPLKISWMPATDKPAWESIYQLYTITNISEHVSSEHKQAG